MLGNPQKAIFVLLTVTPHNDDVFLDVNSSLMLLLIKCEGLFVKQTVLWWFL
jgi:hypothetical protein